MKIRLLLFLWITLTASTFLIGQNRINIVIPTALEEANYVWRTIRDIKILEGFNYTISLPKGALIDSLIAKSKSNRLSDNDFSDLEAFMTNQVYQESNYQKGYQKIEAQRDLINQMVNQIGKCKRNWHFKEFDSYNINLTLYGTGGSYNPEDGSIVIFTYATGKFKQYDKPANTLLHEIIHIGIEESIIGKYAVAHPLKERIVDKFVLLNFEKQLPEYRVQNMGDVRIDAYLKRKKDLKNLDKIVAKFQQEN